MVIPMLALGRRSPISLARIRHFFRPPVPGLFYPVDHRDGNAPRLERSAYDDLGFYCCAALYDCGLHQRGSHGNEEG